MDRLVDDVSGVKSLGSGSTQYPNTTGTDPSVLERFPNKFLGREYEVTIKSKEFTSLCPKTAQPDFAEIIVVYTPDEWCIESKGIKLYFFSYRNEGCFMETITNRILTDLVELVKPIEMTVYGNFAPRGGVDLHVKATYRRDVGVKTKVSASSAE